MKWFFNWVSKKQLEIDNEALLKENALLKAELLNDGHVFFASNKWLGFPRAVRAVVVDGAIVQLSELIGDQA